MVEKRGGSRVTRMKIALRLLDARLPGWGFPHRGSAMAAGLDLHACLREPLDLPAGAAPELIPTGFAMRIGDPGWCGLVAPRSGLGHRGLVLGNTVGVIDADYEGEILVSAWNRNAPGTPAIRIVPGDRIAQLLLVPVGQPVFEAVQAFPEPSARGEGGFGSTGRHGASSAAGAAAAGAPGSEP